MKSFTLLCLIVSLPSHGLAQQKDSPRLARDAMLARAATLVQAADERTTPTVIGLSDSPTGVQSMQRFDQADSHSKLYYEARRPQFHFSSRRGWLNDPHLVFYDGEYHLFYEYIPHMAHFPLNSNWWIHAHWGHAVSRDLLHWQELPIALSPDERGAIFSGSLVVDWNNTASLQKGDKPPLIAMYTTAGESFTQDLAFSHDRGRTWTKYENNPVIPHIVGNNRDPQVFWYAPGEKWVMALYLDKSNFALFSSLDLKEWVRMSDITLPDEAECPELFELSVDGDPKNTRWIFHGAKGRYLIGKFDGTSFTAESGPYDMQRGNAWYASQTFNDIPASDGRRILIPWASTVFMDPSIEPLYKDMPFNQSMGVPVELTLRTTEEGLRLFANPVKELASLRTKAYRVKSQAVRPGENAAAGVQGKLLDIEADVSPANAKQVAFSLRGVAVTYDAVKQELSIGGKSAPLRTQNGRITLRFLVDATSIETFGNEGRLYMAIGVKVPSNNRSVQLTAKDGDAVLNSLEAFELRSIWH
jgi:fructan beta-fructosidase